MLILFELECLFPLFAKDTFLAVLDTSGKLSIYWSNQNWDKPREEKYLQPWKEVHVFVMPDSTFTVDSDEFLRFRFKIDGMRLRLYDNPLVEHLKIIEGHYPGRVTRRGTWGEAYIR